MREFFLPFVPGFPTATYPFGLYPFAGLTYFAGAPVIAPRTVVIGDDVTLDRAIGDADTVQGGGTRTAVFEKGTP